MAILSSNFIDKFRMIVSMTGSNFVKFKSVRYYRFYINLSVGVPLIFGHGVNCAQK